MTNLCITMDTGGVAVLRFPVYTSKFICVRYQISVKLKMISIFSTVNLYISCFYPLQIELEIYTTSLVRYSHINNVTVYRFIRHNINTNVLTLYNNNIPICYFNILLN